MGDIHHIYELNIYRVINHEPLCETYMIKSYLKPGLRYDLISWVSHNDNEHSEIVYISIFMNFALYTSLDLFSFWNFFPDILHFYSNDI